MFEFRFFSGETRTRHLNALTAICGLILGLALAAPVAAQNAIAFDIPAQNLSTALSEYARQSGLEMLYSPEIVADRTSTTVDGDMTRPDALRQLLQGTGLEFEQTPSGGMMVGDEAALAAYRAELAANNASAGQNTIGQRRPGIEEIIVTGQKREERIQDVPIAISAFSPEDLEAQKIEGGFDLLKGVPNVTFSKTNFSGYNFQIRGIGTQAVSATTDPGVAVSFNSTTLIVNRLFEQEYLDVERVEVLRGPQGTLFGRNATGGVINVISNKPELGVWDGMLDLEVGNYSTRRLRGFFNAPIGDTFAIRGAYASTKRDGYGYNEASETNGMREFGDDVRPDVDGRDLWTGRLTLGWQPTDRTRVNLLWERFEEDDNRVRTSKQLCHRDPGPEILHFDDEIRPEGVDTTFLLEAIRADISQGCQPGSLYADEAYGTPNGASLPYISASFYTALYADFFGNVPGGHFSLGFNPDFENPAVPDCRSAYRWTPLIDVCSPDPYTNPESGEPKTQSRSLRSIHSLIEPTYRATADIFELSIDHEVTDGLTFSSQTVYVEDEYYASQDYNRFTTFPVFNDSLETCSEFNVGPLFGLGHFLVPDCTQPGEQFLFQGVVPTGSFDGGRGTYAGGFYADVSPNGVVCDPQLGCSDTLVVQDLSRSESTQFNQEFRLVSSFAGDFNFSLGANFTRFETLNDYFVFSNTFTALLNFWPFNFANPNGQGQSPAGTFGSGLGWCPDKNGIDGTFCRYVDPNPIESIDGEGHNYFRSANPYELTSSAIFGEAYWNLTDTVKLTTGLRLTWDKKVFSPIPSQLFLADYRQMSDVSPGDPPPAAENCHRQYCPLAGTAFNGRGAPPNPDIVQEWREPTGRVVLDWKPDVRLNWVDESMMYASFSHGYKGGGANPPTIAPPAGFVAQRASAGAVPPTFDPEYVNAYEVGTKNTLFGGGVVLNATAFYYDYTDYQVSKIVDRTAANENFDAEVWGLEFESIFAPTPDTAFNATIGYLRTEIGAGEQSIDLMDRTAGGHRHYAADPDDLGSNGRTTDFPEGFDRWMVIKPFGTAPSNCIVPVELMAANFEAFDAFGSSDFVNVFCPTGNPAGRTTTNDVSAYFGQNDDGNWILVDGGGDADFPRRGYDPAKDAPNGGQGFYKDLSGNELPNAPHLTVALGGQHTFHLPNRWELTTRVDWYWQDESYARVYNTEYDRLKSWSNTNLSVWAEKRDWGVTVEAYVKNVFNETPITGTFLNSDDSGLTTNVFTLDPRLIGVSVRKEF